MKTFSLIVLCSVLFALIIPTGSGLAASSPQTVFQDTSGIWRLDKVSPKAPDLSDHPDWQVSASDGSVTFSIPFISHASYGGDTTGTWSGACTWDAETVGLMITPGQMITTQLAAASTTVAKNGVSSSHAFTLLYVESSLIGAARASSNDQSGEVSDSKTLTWSLRPGSYDGERLGVTAVADIGVTTFSYTYEYVWESHDLGNLANLTETPTITLTPSGVRQIQVTGFDGSDTLHLPLTALIQATENGKPLADETVYLKFYGDDLVCLANTFSTWDFTNQKWIPYNGEINLARDDPFTVNTDSHGLIYLRFYLDFYRMSQLSRKLPCALTLRGGIAKASGDTSELITSEASLLLQSPVFITNVYFIKKDDPYFQPGRWVPLGYGYNHPKYSLKSHQFPGEHQNWVLERISLDDKIFSPPADDRAFFSPVMANTTLKIDLCTYDPQMDRIHDGDGVAVSVYWLDGAQGLFAQRQETSNRREQNNDPELCLLEVTFSPEAYDNYSTNGSTGWVRLTEHLAGEEIIKFGIEAGVEAAGGPVAWTAFICSVYTSTSALTKIAELGQDQRAVRFRSEVSLSRTPEGNITLYNFEGSPGVLDDQGNEITTAPGEALDFGLSGPIDGPRQGSPSPDTLALRVLLPNQFGLQAPTFEEAGFTAPPGEENGAAGGGASLPWLGLSLMCLAVGLLGLALIGAGIFFWRSRSRSGVALWVWLLIALIALCSLCLCLAGGFNLMPGPQSALSFISHAEIFQNWGRV